MPDRCKGLPYQGLPRLVTSYWNSILPACFGTRVHLFFSTPGFHHLGYPIHYQGSKSTEVRMSICVEVQSQSVLRFKVRIDFEVQSLSRSASPSQTRIVSLCHLHSGLHRQGGSRYLCNCAPKQRKHPKAFYLRSALRLGMKAVTNGPLLAPVGSPGESRCKRV